MISTQSLEMVPPILGRERTFGWYPPAYEQFAKAPYKSMAILDDFSYFKSEKNIENSMEKKAEIDRISESGGTVLSSKLNAIRQDLTRRRIDPTLIRQGHSKKYSSVNQYMNISPNWKPKYPEPNLEVIRYCSAPVSREIKVPCFEVKQPPISHADKRIENNVTENQKPKNISSNNINSEGNLVKKEKNHKLQRPHSAPENYFKVQTSKHDSSKIVRNCQYSNGGTSITKESNKGQRASMSQSFIATAKYESDLARYKWMMEVPGDPFEIKQPHIPVKQPYSQEIADCTILPPEIQMTNQNRDTFFYSTQPFQSMSFEISPNFSSQKYNAMKNQLRNQGKWNYSSKNFAFVY